MPGILDIVVQQVEALAPIEPNSEYEVKLWVDRTTDVNYLKESAKKLHNEAAQVKQAVISPWGSHFASTSIC